MVGGRYQSYRTASGRCAVALIDRTKVNIFLPVIDELMAKKRFDEAALVFREHGKDLRQSIGALVQGNLFSEARRLVRKLTHRQSGNLISSTDCTSRTSHLAH